MLNQVKELIGRLGLKKINLRRVLLYLLYLILTLALQNMVLTHIRPLGVCPFILPAAVVAVAVQECALPDRRAAGAGDSRQQQGGDRVHGGAVRAGEGEGGFRADVFDDRAA